MESFDDPNEKMIKQKGIFVIGQVEIDFSF